MTSAREGRRLAVDLHGYGQVARALLPFLQTSGIRVATIRDSTGVRITRPAAGFRRVFVDATSPKYEGPGANAWVDTIAHALAGGTPVVTCNKAPLAIGWTRIVRAAKKGETTIACSATVGAGTPVLPLLRRFEQTHGIVRVTATLNATLGYVLDRVARGASIPAAVRGAQRAGFAEPDPTLDLDGTDANAKGVIVHNLVFPERPPLALDGSRPRLRLEPARIRTLARSGRIPRAVSVVSPESIKLSVTASEKFPEKGIGRVQVRVVLRDGSEAFLAGPGGGPRVTAAAVLGDLLALDDYRAIGVRP